MTLRWKHSASDVRSCVSRRSSRSPIARAQHSINLHEIVFSVVTTVGAGPVSTRSG